MQVVYHPAARRTVTQGDAIRVDGQILPLLGVRLRNILQECKKSQVSFPRFCSSPLHGMKSAYPVVRLVRVIPHLGSNLCHGANADDALEREVHLVRGSNSVCAWREAVVNIKREREILLTVE